MDTEYVALQFMISVNDNLWFTFYDAIGPNDIFEGVPSYYGLSKYPEIKAVPEFFKQGAMVETPVHTIRLQGVVSRESWKRMILDMTIKKLLERPECFAFMHCGGRKNTPFFHGIHEEQHANMSLDWKFKM